MKIKNIIIPLGDPKSVFIELLIKYFKSKNYKSLKKKIILIGSNKIIKSQKKKFNLHLNINCIKDINDNKLKRINIIDINFENLKHKYNHKIATKKYIERCLNLSLSIIKNNSNSVLFNGPISKKEFLEKKFLGITEYLAKKTKSKDFAMLIYNSKLSVCPITTHLPIKFVAKNINKKKIINKVSLINKFYKKKLNRSPKFAILGLNPHCETILKYSEEDKIIKPAINLLKSKKIKIDGPISADTFFIKKNIEKYDVVVGMYHDQVLTPLKTLYNFYAVNITLGLPFIRVSPDHGPNIQMFGKYKSDPSSIFCAMEFFNQI